MNPGAKIKILPADDQQACHQAIGLALRGWEAAIICGSAFNGAHLAGLLPSLLPDVIIMDIHMPVMDGVEATRLVKEFYPAIKILAYTVFDDEERIKEMMDAGANGYILKSAGRADLKRAIKTVMEGKTYYCTSINETLTQVLLRDHSRAILKAKASGLLSEQEQAVLQLICRQHTSQEIANNLFMSVKTVEKYRAQLVAKTQSRNVAGLVLYAYAHGLFEPSK